MGIPVSALHATEPTYRRHPRRPLSKYITIRGQRRQTESVLVAPSSLLLREVRRRRPWRHLQPHGRLHDGLRLRLPLLLLRLGAGGGGGEVDEARGVEEGEELPEERDVADERLADLGEGEAAGGVLAVPADDVVAVLPVDPRVPRRRPEPAPPGAAEELRQRPPLRLVDLIPLEPTCESAHTHTRTHGIISRAATSSSSSSSSQSSPLLTLEERGGARGGGGNLDSGWGGGGLPEEAGMV